MPENINPLNDQFTRAIEQRAKAKSLKEKITAHIQYLHQRFEEEQDPSHIVTLGELAVALNVSKKELSNMLHRAFAHSTLNEILESLGLPHKKNNYY